MLFSKFLRRLILRAPKSKHFRKTSAAARFRLTLETLEDRLAPAVLTVNTLVGTPFNAADASMSLGDAMTLVHSQDETGISTGLLNQITGTLGQNDTIIFAPNVTGTIALTASPAQITENVQILGPGPSQLTIDGGSQFQIFSANATASIEGLTLSDGAVNNVHGGQGGAIFGTNLSNLTVNNCAFTNNQAEPVNPPGDNGGGGGAIFSTGALTVTNSTFTGNSAYDGGAINVSSNGSLVLDHDAFDANFGAQLGGAVASYTSASVQNCVFNANISGPSVLDTDGQGGAICVEGDSLVATNDSFNANVAAGTAGNTVGGGAVADTGGALNLADCTFANNTADTQGGAVYINGYTPAPVVIVDCTVVGNSAQLGGGLFCNYGYVQLTNDTIVANSVASANILPLGGGIEIGAFVNVTLDNTIVAGNHFSSDTSNIDGTVAPASANNLLDSISDAGGLTNGANGNLVGVDPALLPLGNYGGPTETILPTAGSPAIDAGSTAFVTDQATDQRGFSRISGSKDGVHGFNVDIGAVEVQPAGVGTHLELQGPPSISAGAPMSWTATALDDNNVPAYAGFGPIVMSVASGPGNFSPASTTVVNAVYGQADFNNLNLFNPGSYVLQASFGNSSVTAPLVVTGGNLVFVTQPDGAGIKAGSVLVGLNGATHQDGLPIMIAVLDSNGNPIFGDDEPITLRLTQNHSGTLVALPFGGGQTAVTGTLVNGVVSFESLTVNIANPAGPAYVLQAIVDGSTATSSDFIIGPGAASQLAFIQQPTNVAVGKAVSPAVSVAVEDAYGNRVTTDNTASTINLALTGTSHGEGFGHPTNGFDTFPTVKVSTAGTYTLTVTTTEKGVASAISSSFVVSLDPVVGPPQNAIVATKYAAPLYAKVSDPFTGAPIAGVAVTFTAPAAGPSGTFGGRRTVTVRTNAAGIATAPAFTANTRAGNFVITVSFGGEAPAETIALNNRAGPPSLLTMVGAEPKATSINSPFVALPAALVTDRYGNPITGAAVTYTAPTNGPSATVAGQLAVTVLTDANGFAVAPTFTADNEPGTVALRVSTPHVSSAVIKVKIVRESPENTVVSGWNGEPT
jgi:predicted outer membrane repeat protein